MINVTWSIPHDIIYSKVDDEIIIMSIGTDSYIGLDPVGSRIWELLSNKPSSLESIVDQLMDEYDIDNETCKKDVQFFFDDMVSKNLLKKSDD